MLICFGFSVSALFISFFAEYAWNLVPCILCMLQRFPLFVIIPLSIFGLCTDYKWSVLFLLKTAFLILGILAGYHLLVQTGLVSDPCHVPQIKTIDDFKNLMDQRSPSCKMPSWSLFGIPASGYNVIFAFLFLLLLPSKDRKESAF